MQPLELETWFDSRGIHFESVFPAVFGMRGGYLLRIAKQLAGRQDEGASQ
jgi:hypothetical protein